MTQEQIITILISAGVVAGVGLLIGLFLGLSGKLLAVPTDERAEQIRACLPGNNCGGCGYSGCDALARAIADGEAPPSACPVGGQAAIDGISAVLGVEATAGKRCIAFVKCAGTCDKANFRYAYFGDGDCHRVALAPGRGGKVCAYGCTGLGSCARACPFDAIKVVNGCALVDPARCRGCGVCVAVCPNHLIELIPVDSGYAVRCASREKGKAVRLSCAAGCLGCGLCARVCSEGAITVSENMAHIDQSKCIGCGKCAEKCPAHIIVRITTPQPTPEADASSSI